MNLFIRLMLVLLSGHFRPKLKVTDSSVLFFVVCPNDLDIYAHMNNGRYLTVMDLGRIDLILRSPLGEVASKNKWNPLVAASHMIFKRPLKIFETYRLRTRILGWDHKWFFIEQRFEHRNKVIATGYVKGLFRGPEGNIPSEEALKRSGHTQASPDIHSIIQLFEATASKLSEK